MGPFGELDLKLPHFRWRGGSARHDQDMGWIATNHLVDGGRCELGAYVSNLIVSRHGAHLDRGLAAGAEANEQQQGDPRVVARGASAGTHAFRFTNANDMDHVECLGIGVSSTRPHHQPLLDDCVLRSVRSQSAP